MKKPWLVLLAVCCAYAVASLGHAQPPLKQIHAFQMPGSVRGPFDHIGVDLRGRRLFATAENYKAVLVLDLDTGKLIHTIGGIGKPHAVLYRADLHRLYVTDGVAGAVQIFDARTYRHIGSVKLEVDSDSISYDPATHYLYVVNGGGDAHQTFSFVSIVDTTAGKKIGDIKIDGDTLEAMALEKTGPRLYVNNPAKNEVNVIDREKRTLLAVWPVTGARHNVPMAFDEAHHRLFVGCRSGQVVVFDTETGKQLQMFPIGGGVDDLVYDPASRRIYAACNGAVYVYKETDPDHYDSLGSVPSGPGARTARLIPRLKRYFVAVPQHGNTNAQILVYAVE